MACVILSNKSSQYLFLFPPHCALLSSFLYSTMCIILMAMRRSNSFAIHDVKLIGRKEDISDAGFPGFKRGIIVALRQTCGQTLSFHERVEKFFPGCRSECLDESGSNFVRACCALCSHTSQPFLHFCFSEVLRAFFAHRGCPGWATRNWRWALPVSTLSENSSPTLSTHTHVVWGPMLESLGRRVEAFPD